VRLIAAAIVLAGFARAPQPPAKASRTDETVAVQRGTRLRVDNFAGDVVIHTWDKGALHVVARHQSRTTVRVRQTPAGVVLSASGGMGRADSVDYDITAPSWMPLKVDGTYCVITIDGTQAEVSAESVRGDISIKGGTGFVTAKSVEGSVVVEGARGKLAINSVNETIDISDATGDIIADAINGSIRMQRIASRSVDVSTVNGEIGYQGAIAEGGHYSFASHHGDVLLDIPETSNATVSVRTYNGSFRSPFAALQPPNRSPLQRGTRVTMTMGTGSTDVAVESFSGTIRIGPGSRTPRER
jgi:DUF4097 and DUF4098 domain-containing protein YvlB